MFGWFDSLWFLIILAQLPVKKCVRPIVYIIEKCNTTNALSFLHFFLFLWAFLNILTWTLDSSVSLSVFALFIQIRLVNMHDVHHLMKAVIKLHALTLDWISRLCYLKIMKVRICHSFTIRTLVNLQLSVIWTSELVLVASNKQSIFSGTAE